MGIFELGLKSIILTEFTVFPNKIFTPSSRGDISPIPPHDGTIAEVPKKSVIWEYYIMTGADTAVCKSCNR